MPSSHAPMRDPRTIARDIPGIFELLFPRLTVGIVAGVNSNIRSCDGVGETPLEMVRASALEPAMLFEVAVARAEQVLNGSNITDWNKCLKIATNRQRRYFDAHTPHSLTRTDIIVAEQVAGNLVYMLRNMQKSRSGNELITSPFIAGYQWVSSTEGDFALGTELIEIKCTHRKFSMADYRQVLMYWLLSYASSVERDSSEWTGCTLLNPRLNHMLDVSFDEIISLVSGGRSKVQLLQLFAGIIGDYGLKSVSDLI